MVNKGEACTANKPQQHHTNSPSMFGHCSGNVSCKQEWMAKSNNKQQTTMKKGPTGGEKKQGGGWGPMFKNKQHFTDMHLF